MLLRHDKNIYTEVHQLGVAMHVCTFTEAVKPIDAATAFDPSVLTATPLTAGHDVSASKSLQAVYIYSTPILGRTRL